MRVGRDRFERTGRVGRRLVRAGRRFVGLCRFVRGRRQFVRGTAAVGQRFAVRRRRPVVGRTVVGRLGVRKRWGFVGGAAATVGHRRLGVG